MPWIYLMQYRSDNYNHRQYHQFSVCRYCCSEERWIDANLFTFDALFYLLRTPLDAHSLIMRRNFDNDKVIATNTHTHRRQFINQSCIQLCDMWAIIWVKYHFNAFIVHYYLCCIISRTSAQEERFIYKMRCGLFGNLFRASFCDNWCDFVAQ